MNIDELPIQWQEHKSSIIKVFGVGGGGGNAVNYMYQQGIHNVNFVICNTDEQALNESPVPTKIQMAKWGAGGDPKVGREAAMNTLDKIREVLDTGTNMVFLTAGMGGGTGTGATPVIARVAKELGILTVAIVTMPFAFEGPQRIEQAIEGINELKDHVDSLLVINNEKLRELYGNLTMTNVWSKADNVLTMAAKGIAELITLPGTINVDFKDVNSIMAGGGITVMGSASESGENRARKAVEAALNSPLLDNNDITGARRILLNITSGVDEHELTMDEVSEITNYVTRSARNASMIWGVGKDRSLGDAVNVTIVATDFANVSYIGSTGFPPPPPPPPLPPPPPGPNPAGNQGGPVKVILGLEDEVKYAGSSVTAPSPQPQPVRGKPYVVERPAPGKTENKWFQPSLKFETDTMTDVLTEPAEREYTRAIPYVVDENIDIDELDNTPAIVRKKLKLENQLTGVEKEVSKYTLSTDKKENTVRLRDNNSYLYDVVD